MAFGGAPAFTQVVGGAEPMVNSILMTGASLAARAGAPAIAAADTGELTTAAAGANQTAIPATFGRGRGNWRAGDAACVLVEIDDDDGTAAANAAAVHLANIGAMSPKVVAGDLVIDFHNRGVGATAAGFQIKLVWLNGLTR